MKAQLEAPCKLRGLILEAENKEDEAALWELWHHKGKPVTANLKAGELFSLLIAPTAEEGETE